MFVKICGLSDATQVSAAVEAGADAVGFVFHAASVRNVSVAAANAAASALPEYVRKVAVMLHPTDDEWQEVLDGFQPDALQTDAGDFASLEVPQSIERWPVYRENSAESTGTAPEPGGAMFVYEGAHSGQGQTVDWKAAAEFAGRGRMLIAGGLNAGNVGEAIAAVRPFGVDVSSGVETSPGTKDPRKIHEFIAAARAAGKRL